MQGYFENIFYQLASQDKWFLCWTAHHLSLEDGEMMIFFSFLISTGFCPAHHGVYTGLMGEIASLITQLIQEMKGQDLLDDYIEDHDLRTQPALRPRLSFKGYLCKINTKHDLNCAILTYGANTIIDKWQTLFLANCLFSRNISGIKRCCGNGSSWWNTLLKTIVKSSRYMDLTDSLSLFPEWRLFKAIL